MEIVLCDAFSCYIFRLSCEGIKHCIGSSVTLSENIYMQRSACADNVVKVYRAIRRNQHGSVQPVWQPILTPYDSYPGVKTS